MVTTPSKFNQYVFIGKSIKGTTESQKKNSHPITIQQAEPTEVFFPDKQKQRPYCSYCVKIASPIQQIVKREEKNREFPAVRYSCTCEGAKAEIEYRRQFLSLQKKQEEERNSLRKNFNKKLQQNIKLQIKIKKSYLQKELEEEMRQTHPNTNFESIESKIQPY